jgi:serine/threonine-protein phosphatase PGAM5
LHEKIPSIPPSIEEEMKIFMEKYPQFSFTTLDEHLRQSEMAFETFFKAPKIDSESSYELLVCHGNLIRFFICKALLIDIDTWIKLEMNHCGISIVNINDSGNMQLVSHNETKHIPSSMVSV